MAGSLEIGHTGGSRQGKGRVEVIAPSELAKEYKTTVSQIILGAQQQGYTVLGWNQYQNLLDEIGSLIGEDKESLPGTIVGIPVTTTPHKR